MSQLFVAPSSARRIVRGAVDNYSLNAKAIRRIDALSSDEIAALRDKRRP
jgi:hypothetical protein